MQNINCPGCGGEIRIINPGIITSVCEYCENAVYWDKEKVTNAGKQSVLPEGFSRLYRGAAGLLFNKRFIVQGRVRYSFGKGFWDEWYIEVEDGNSYWLSEDNHELALEKPSPYSKSSSDAYSLKPGSQFNHDNKLFIIEEVGRAKCLGMEGNLPIQITTGEEYTYADGSTPDGNYTIGIEFDENPPTIFVGNHLKYQSIKLDNEGTAW